MGGGEYAVKKAGRQRNERCQSPGEPPRLLKIKPAERIAAGHMFDDIFTDTVEKKVAARPGPADDGPRFFPDGKAVSYQHAHKVVFAVKPVVIGPDAGKPPDVFIHMSVK